MRSCAYCLLFTRYTDEILPFMAVQPFSNLMSNNTGRNDPCPCGSGKKYKQCCLRAADQAIMQKAHDGAAERAIDWLMKRHQNAVSAAFDEMIFHGLSDSERDALHGLDKETWQGIQVNATEWLLAEGHILINGQHIRVSDALMGRGGPLFTVGQRHWIEQLARQSLRLYDVTDVIAGRQMTLCDSLDTETAPIIVHEVSGSKGLRIGTQIGVRLMQVENHFELSGAAYPFSPLWGPRLVALMRESIERDEKQPRELSGHLSYLIRSEWLKQYLNPMPIPNMVDTYSGDPVLLITDHYLVQDWDALVNALASQTDIEGDRLSGWSRIIECDDGQIRSTASINIGKGADKIELFYKTQNYADQGRRWIDTLAGHAVKFTRRVLSDPKGALAKMSAGKSLPTGTGTSDLPPEVMAEAIENALRRAYANWADEPLQALGGKAPRDAIKTDAGLERVKGLMRSYEADEKQQAAQQGRREVSYAFLWDAIGIVR